MSDRVTVLITGAAGNLGSLLARHLLPTGHDLRLMFHRKPIPEKVRSAPNVTAVQADLANPDTLGAAVRGADVVVHFAGVLFAPRPEQFLPDTNVGWFSNLLEASDLNPIFFEVLIMEGPKKFADSSSTSLVPGFISVFLPPMIPAIATAPFSSAMTRSFLSSFQVLSSIVCIFSFFPAFLTMILFEDSRSLSKACIG